jgi:hypothetical protein
MKSSEAFAPIETASPGPERVVVVVCAAFFASRFAFAARNLARISWKREGGKEGGRDREKEKERGGGERERCEKEWVGGMERDRGTRERTARDTEKVEKEREKGRTAYVHADVDVDIDLC